MNPPSCNLIHWEAGEEFDGSVPGEAEVLDDSQSEEPRRVEAQTLAGDLASALGSPVGSYSTSCTASNQLNIAKR
ncbi:hypothetical protein D7V80_25765 [Corallococcus sp. CA054B]|uniref:hypothetical protein n=1 Tax=Corallococcus sp. CA054B TaxID=2316734 RepID=UPI000EA215EC|nr:hypothetical protein [Corallococcus sp. CA054B]RKG64739.1 hypothetical protein D7V80_25765 [Corallococcus sp. CA054B]